MICVFFSAAFNPAVRIMVSCYLFLCWSGNSEDATKMILVKSVFLDPCRCQTYTPFSPAWEAVSGQQYLSYSCWTACFPAFWRGLAVSHQGQCTATERSKYADSYSVELLPYRFPEEQWGSFHIGSCAVQPPHNIWALLWWTAVRKVRFEHRFEGSEEHGSRFTWASTIICVQSG